MEELFARLRALADPTRFRVVEMLLARDFCVGGLARRLRISEAAVSQHLRILRDVGLVTGSKSGYFVHYEVDRDMFGKIADQLVAMSKTPRIEMAPCQPHAKDECPNCGLHDGSFAGHTQRELRQ